MTTTPSGWVVDASVALKWSLRDEENLEEADLLYAAFAAQEVELTAPNFIRYEVASALAVANVRGRVTADDAKSKFEAFLDTGVCLANDDDELLRAAMDASRQYAISPYDSLYVVLAQQLRYFLVTADRKLFQKVEAHVPNVRWLADIRVIA